MAKKKRKTFSKRELLSLFDARNYQKVISKIKQFNITDMDEEALHKIKVESYQGLSASNFEAGDINRALRDIDSLLSIENGENYQLIRLKYLCYIENFQMAIEFAKALIVSKNVKIKKEAIFLYLLANIYNGNNDLEVDYLKTLTVAKQNYILAMVELFKNNISEALKFLDDSNPRAKIEKENIQAIKALLLHQEVQESDRLKPLYRFLLFADTENLQNTKSTREIKKDMASKVAKEKDGINDLISLKYSVSVKSILYKVTDKELQTKLIYNNIILLVEKQNNTEEALNLFVKYRNDLVHIVESGNLFIRLRQSNINVKNDNKNMIMTFFEKYLKLHHKKLSSFQKDFIFTFLYQTKDLKSISDLIKKYNGDSVLFLVEILSSMDKYTTLNQTKLNTVLKKYSILYLELFEGYALFIDHHNQEYDKIGDLERKQFLNNIMVTLSLMKNVARPHKNYKLILIKILSSISGFIQRYEFKENEEAYMLASETINTLVEYYHIEQKDLSENILNLKESIKKKKSMRGKTEDSEKSFFEMMKMFKGEMEDVWMEDDEDDYYDENDYEELELIKEEFIEALKNSEDPIKSIDPIDIVPYMVFNFLFDLLSEAVKYNAYNNELLFNLLHEMLDVDVTATPYRDIVTNDIVQYAKKDAHVASLILSDLITGTENKKRESLWFLGWLEAYVSMVDDYGLKQEKLYKGAIYHFMRVQQKKKYKKLNGFKELDMRERYKKMELSND